MCLCEEDLKRLNRIEGAIKAAETRKANALKAKRVEAAKKAVETRKANALKAKRCEAARKAVETKRRNAEERLIQERLEDYRQRGFKAAETKRRNLELKKQKNSERAKKAWVTIRANKETANK